MPPINVFSLFCKHFQLNSFALFEVDFEICSTWHLCSINALIQKWYNNDDLRKNFIFVYFIFSRFRFKLKKEEERVLPSSLELLFHLELRAREKRSRMAENFFLSSNKNSWLYYYPFIAKCKQIIFCLRKLEKNISSVKWRENADAIENMILRLHKWPILRILQNKLHQYASLRDQTISLAPGSDGTKKCRQNLLETSYYFNV